MALYGGAAICWCSLVFAVELEMRRFFDPRPPVADYFMMSAVASGLITEAAGVIYFLRRRTFEATNGELFLASIAMVGALPPLCGAAITTYMENCPPVGLGS